MQIKEVSLEEVLMFREWKANTYGSLLQAESAGIVISLGMNIPGPIKCSPSILLAFHEGMRCVKNMIVRLQGKLIKVETSETNSGCAAIYLVKNVDPYLLKRESVEIEHAHMLGRLFDIDIINPNREIITREEVGSEKRKCLICNQDAKVCGRSRKHTVEELQNKTFSIIEKWMDNFAENIGMQAYKALIDEVYTTPKPGLVDLYSCGAHKDMDVETFENSANALRPFFTKIAKLGMREACTEKELFQKIRKIGIEAENNMYKATNGVNTHKGLIFTLGIYCAAAGRSIREYGEIREKQLRDIQQRMTKEILTEELEEIKLLDAKSNGEKNLKKYGTSGIRGEAIAGYPIVWEIALPVLHQGMKEGKDYNLVRLQTFFNIMAHTEDSNVLARKNMKALKMVQEQAKAFLEKGGAYNPENYQELYKMDTDFIYENISPGGSADLLATTIFMEMILNG